MIRCKGSFDFDTSVLSNKDRGALRSKVSKDFTQISVEINEHCRDFFYKECGVNYPHNLSIIKTIGCVPPHADYLGKTCYLFTYHVSGGVVLVEDRDVMLRPKTLYTFNDCNTHELRVSRENQVCKLLVWNHAPFTGYI